MLLKHNAETYCIKLQTYEVYCHFMLIGMLEVIQQRLWDNFSKQSKEEQGLYYCHMMALSAALARCSPNGHARAADFHCQLILHAISNHLYSILRPKILATTEMVSCLCVAKMHLSLLGQRPVTGYLSSFVILCS